MLDIKNKIFKYFYFTRLIFRFKAKFLKIFRNLAFITQNKNLPLATK